MVRYFILVAFFVISAHLVAQVGINNPSPDANAVLDLSATNKGLLIPRMNTNQREAFSNLTPTEGMLVFDSELKMFFAFYDSAWYSLNPWKTEYLTDNNADTAHMTTMIDTFKHGNVGIGVSVPKSNLEVRGDIKADTVHSTVLYAIEGKGITPLGGIIMWSGKVAPDGWALCNGSSVNGYKTPDLRGRFVVGYDSSDTDYIEPGNLSSKGNTNGIKGGLDSVAIDKTQMPAHNHNDSTEVAGKHEHSLNGDEAGGISGSSGCSNCDFVIYNGDGDRHSIVGYTNKGGEHKHRIKMEGGGKPHENRPPYYALAYIMRVE